jgi:rhodanese-related sulfurtransferase
LTFEAGEALIKYLLFVFDQRFSLIYLRGVIMKKTWLSILIAAICLMLVAAVYAAAQSNIPRISIKELKSMMDKGTPVIIIDVQPAGVYAEGHIKGAISLPASQRIKLEDVWDFPYDRLIVTYCDCGPGETDSADAAAQLMKFGYDEVKVLADPSIKGWKEAKYPLEKKK